MPSSFPGSHGILQRIIMYYNNNVQIDETSDLQLFLM